MQSALSVNKGSYFLRSEYAQLCLTSTLNVWAISAHFDHILLDVCGILDIWISWTHPFDNFSDKDRVISKATRNFHNCLVSSGIIYVDCNTENVFYLLVINTTCSILEKLFKSLSLDLTDA